MDETERERSRREKSAYFNDVLGRLTAMGITDLKTRADIAEHEWYLFTLNCEYYEQERLNRRLERERQREIKRRCSQSMDEAETTQRVKTPSTDHDEKQKSATDHDQQPEGEKRGDGGAELGTDATEGDGDEPESETTESLELLAEIDGMLSGVADITRTAAANVTPRFKTGITTLDEALGGGLYEGLHVLMAPPSEGKTANSLFMCLKALSEDANKWGIDDQVLYWGLDTSESDVRARLASCVSVLKGKELGIEPFAYKDVPSDELIRLNQHMNDVERYRKNPANHERELRECREAIKEIMGGTVSDYLKATNKVEEMIHGRFDNAGFKFMRPTDSTRNDLDKIFSGWNRQWYLDRGMGEKLTDYLELEPLVNGYGEEDWDKTFDIFYDETLPFSELVGKGLIGRVPAGDEVELLLSYLNTEDVRLCVVDYLKPLKIAPKNGKGDEQQRKDRIIELLSDAAMEKKIPIALICDMSKTGVQSDRPDMMNASGSSTLQYKAETITEMRTKKKGQGENTVELHIEKNKRGKPCTVKLKYLPAYNCFAEVKEAKQEDAGTAREGR